MSDPERSRGRGAHHGAVPVSELTLTLKGHIEGAFRRVQVYGEVSSARPASGGHLYFTLKDAEAALSCVIWSSTLARLPLRLDNGMRVILFGDIQVYARRGNYQLIVQRVADMGLGDMLARIDALKRRLLEEGLLALDRKRPLPFMPRRVGVVTAASGAAIRDILSTLRGRFPTDVLIASVRVQGEGASGEIARALAALATRPGVEVIIVGRGGGSHEDLAAFNEEEVARAIVACPVPVVSAVGHAIDQSVADLVADASAVTPTAAAERVVPRRDELAATLARQRARLGQALTRHQREQKHALAAIAARLPDPRRLVAERGQRLDDARAELEGALAGRLEVASRRLQTLDARLSNLHPRETARRASERLAGLRARLDRAALGTVEASRRRLDAARRTLTVLSPTASLDRGYAIVRRPDGGVVRDARLVDDGAIIDVILHRGALSAAVTARRGRNAWEPEES